MARLYRLMSGMRIAASYGPGFAFIVLTRIALVTFRSDIVDRDNRPRDTPVRSVLPQYDFIVVGGGSSGAVLANRLSENPEWNVLLLEAGGDEQYMSDVPLCMTALPNSQLDWRFKTEPQRQACKGFIESRSSWPRGKVLGGCSTINGMLYIRGNRRDYDQWASFGNRGWSYDEILPYFKKSEDMRIHRLRNDPYHGVDGELTVEHYKYYSHIAEDFIEAGKELGLEERDVNGEIQTGLMKSHGTLRQGLRCSTAKAFLRPATQRPNLHISMFSMVHKILFSEVTDVHAAGGPSLRAVGVEFRKDKSRRLTTVYASREVVLAAGAVQTPQLLMVSGVGPAHHLQQVGVPVALDVPGVGENLQDHIALGGTAYLIDSPPEAGPMGETFVLPRAATLNTLLGFITGAGGPMYAWPQGDVMAFVKTKFANLRDDWPDVQLFLASVSDASDGGTFNMRNLGVTEEVYAEVYEPILYHEAYSVVPLLLRPRSRGTIRIRSANMADHPVIDPNYLADPMDVAILVEGAKIGYQLLGTNAMRHLNARINPNMFPACKNLTFLSDEYWECQARQYSMTIYHPVGTCKMGPPSDPMAVVDARLRFYGIRGLRVVDASVMPTIPSGNTNAPVVMVAEKAADMIKEDWNWTPNGAPVFFV